MSVGRITGNPSVCGTDIIRVRVPANTPCLIHKGGFNKKGHGICSYKGKSDYAHRVVLKKKGIYLGPKDLVHHVCENKGCINVDHLKVVIWSVHSSEHNRGVANSQAILTDEIVKNMRQTRINNNWSFAKIAKAFGVSKSSAVKICNYDTWRHVT